MANMRYIWRFFTFLFQLAIVAGLLLLMLFGIRKWQTYDQVHRVSQMISQEQNTSASAPKNWDTLEDWWLVNANGQLIYNTKALPQYQNEVAQAVSWWNKAAGKQIIIPQTTQTIADVYFAPVRSEYLSFSGLASNNHKILFNETAQKNNTNNADVVNIFIHELGHALGLAHAPQSYNDVMSPSQIASGAVRQVSQYDRDALTSALNRINKVRSQSVSAAAYVTIAGQQPVTAASLTNLSDPIQNARQPLADVLQQTITKATNADNDQTTTIDTAKQYLQKLKYDADANNTTIHAAENALRALIVANKQEKYFPFAFSNSDTPTQHNDDLNNILGND
ncbi:hypothetical protein FD09_GL001934 [Schleiferilactobacillus perolens DSM 12744]|uniref:Peptidase M10 metallopeptidase domain-containing protein n=2 Tax=Schleiferilactobacillus perolens TaxID=100468 RepID=A0A0R1N0U9_9LACO|nr:hypothetical protein FD09_GL001934 [Schleiferilactobacillus perolens DSM 12744]